MVVPLVAVFSGPTLIWFAHHWTVTHTDAPRYLLAASGLVTGGGITDLNGLPYNGGHGPGFPALIGFLILLFGHNAEALVWAVRLLALVNPLLAYFLVKRLSSPPAGLIAAALVSLFGFGVKTTLSIDAALLTFYLSALLALVAAIKRGSSVLALLSGVLLGASILTKETAFTSLPLALLAVLLIGWDLRGALWHYLGVVLVSLPWWIWAYSASGKVYLLDRLPTSLQVPIVIVGVIVLGLAVLAYASGLVGRFLADERRRRWSGWYVALAWTVSLSVLLLTTGTHALAKASFESLRQYLAQLLAPSIVVVPALGLLSGYVIWKALRRNGPWRLLALALLSQVPVSLLLVVEGWAPRQFLVPQTLLFCTLGALVVDALKVAAGAAASPESSYPARLAGAVVIASLAVLLVIPTVERVRALLPENPGGASEHHRVAPQATEMIHWMAENVPGGKRVLVTPAYALNRYLAFLDGGRHEWTFMRLDQEPCKPRPNIQVGCNPHENDISRIQPDAVWVQVNPNCRAISLSMSNLLEQVRRTGSGYVMISGYYEYPGILGLPARLQESGAFEVVHTEPGHGGGLGASRGLVLLKSTGRAPEAVPTQMDASTVLNLKRCEQAKGQGYPKWLRSEFPNGILQVPAHLAHYIS
ncbi:MAG: glycosyltransferase family 39 protein [Chloroflexota bacterium]|nr:glycosyltransferase family 39 protein [Chloroflexota bacterium]